MITRKTKLFTGLVAVVMLISMFAMFAMPAVAEETGIDVSKLPKASAIASYPNVTGYVVADLDDYNFVSKNASKFTADKTLYITGDIDANGSALTWSGVAASIDGMGNTISNVKVQNNWLGDYAGASIKNITFEGFSAASISVEQAVIIGQMKGKTIIENVTVSKVTGTTTGANYQRGLFIGGVNGGGDVTLKNVTVTGCELTTNIGSNSVGLVIGHPNAKVTVDGLYVFNNIINNVGQNSVTPVFGQSQGTVGVKNVAVVGNKMYSDIGTTLSTKGGLIIGIEYAGVTVTNAITSNNQGCKAAVSDYVAVAGKYAYTALEADITTGASVYDANVAVAASGDETLTQWAIKDGIIVAADAENAAPVKVNFFVDGVRSNYYTDADGKLIGVTQDVLDAQEWDQDITLDTVFTKNTTIAVAGAALVTTDLQTAANKYTGKKTEYYLNAEDVADAIVKAAAILDGTNTEATQQDVDDLTDVLNNNASAYNQDENAPAASEYATYPGLLNYSIRTVADLEYVANNERSFNNTITLHFHNDITITDASSKANYLGGTSGNDNIVNGYRANGVHANFDGHGYTITGITLPSTGSYGWLDLYHGSIKNLTFKDMKAVNGTYAALICRTKATQTFENVTIDGAIFNANATSGFFSDTTQGPTTFKNVTIKNSSVYRGGTTARFGYLIGSTGTQTVTVDGLNIYNNTAYAKAYGTEEENQYFDKVTSVMIYASDASATADMKNVAVFNNAFPQGCASFITYPGATISLENVIVAGNDGTCFFWNANTNTIVTEGVYTDKTANLNGTYTQIAAEDVTPEWLYALNVANADEADWANWGVDDGAPVAAYGDYEAVHKISVKVTATNYEGAGYEKTMYTDVNGMLIGAPEDYDDLCADWSSLPSEGFTADGTLTGTHTCVMPEDWSYDAETFEHYKVCTVAPCSYRYAEKCAGETTKPAEPIGPDSKHTVVCDVCGVTSAVPCLFEEDTSRYEAVTCEKGEVRWYVCALDACGVEYKTVGEPNEHDRETTATHGDETPGDRAGSYHYYKCNNENCDDAVGEKTACSWNVVTTPSTCTKDGTFTYDCVTCDAVYVEINQDDLAHHRYGSWYRTKAPTATKAGEKRADCLYCNAYVTEAIPAYGDTAAFAVETDVPSIDAGENAVVYIKLENVNAENGVAGVTFQVTYDNENLKLVSIENGGLFQTATTLGEDGNPIDVEDVANGTVTISALSLQKVTEDGVVVKLTFTTEADAKDGIYGINVTDTDNTVDGKDEEPGDMIEIIDGVGTVTILNAIPGDVTMDGEVTIKDAVAMVQYLGGAIPSDKEINNRVVDFNGDGKKDTADISALLQYLNDKAV